MSQDFLDPEIFSDFIVEAREHLETIEPALLELEKSPGNSDLLNDIFRPMHSLKGASGFLGLNKINGLAHKAESILDELRNGKMVATSEIMDLILSATDALTNMINNLETANDEGDIETRDIIAHIESLMNGGGSVKPSSVSTVPPKPGKRKEKAQPLHVENLPPFDAEPYTLTVIGEGHLQDFLEEAEEILDGLGNALLQLEKNPQGNKELINDLFRYFHNIKGNSGIIGFKELNALTHEAETLLGRVRKGELAPSRGLIDLLLAVSDAMAEILSQVDSKTARIQPVDTRLTLARVKRALEGDIPADSASAGDSASSSMAEGEYDPEDVQAFDQTVVQQLENIGIALRTLSQDSSQKDFVDGLYRSLMTIQNSCGYMRFGDLKVMAERTAGLVDQARKSGLDFELMLDILKQECSIIADGVHKRLSVLRSTYGSKSGDAEPSAKSSVAAPKPALAASLDRTRQEEAAPAEIDEIMELEDGEPTTGITAAPSAAKSAQAGQAQASQKAAAKATTTIRVDHEKLDHLMNVIGELIINRNRFSMLARALESGQEDVQKVAQSLSETTDAMARISDDLQDTIMKVRMVPVSSVFSRFPRLIRDLSRKSGKDVELLTEGEETELDKSLVEVIGDPLVHLIRNSVDHGIETAEERTAAGKPPMGRVWLRAYHKGNSVAIEIADDGRGIDPVKMRRAAVKKGLISEEEAAAMDDREAIELIFAPGFSTAEKITDISGRGVGMDVVRNNIKNLKGSVSITSEVGKGAKFILLLPLTLAIIDALMVTIDNEVFAIPLDAVSETTKIEASRLTEVNTRKAVTLRGDVLGVVDLREILGLSIGEEQREILPIVVIQDQDRRLGIVVDKLLERQEIVIKPLGSYLSDFDLKGVSGATIMGDGSVVLILDPHEIYSLATSTTARSI
ncbi:chemotaxis protein CheA [Desulfocurvibacter africanus]|uniref:chemotaxis protein CheA n=1 Tax=Desulfocurvibacter africanus TaxID=873 RepID=UPI0004116C73|nr:chemotaxis protein CheA [Desulfocurvibacter africanus]